MESNLINVIGHPKSYDLVSNSGLECNITKDNINILHEILEYAIRNKIYLRYNINLPDNTKHNINNEPETVNDNFCLSFEEKYNLAIFLENLILHYEESDQQRCLYKSLIAELMCSKPPETENSGQYQKFTTTAQSEISCSEINLDDVVMLSNQELQKNYTKGFSIDDIKRYLRSYIRGLMNRNKAYSRSILDITILRAYNFTTILKKRSLFHRKLNALGANLDALISLKPAATFPKTHNSKRKILVCGWYGTETLGDKAILGGIVKAITNALGEFELHLVSLELYISQMTIRQMPELEGCQLHSITNALNLIDSMDLVIFGGGPLAALKKTAEMSAIFERAVRAKIPTIAAGCGVGPLGSSYHNKAIKALLVGSSHRIYRDRKSMEIAQSLGVDTSKDIVAEDPALTWLKSVNPKDFSKHDNYDRPAPLQPKLLLGLRSFPYKHAKHLGRFKAEKIQLRFEEELLAGLELLLEEYPRLKILPFPMCTNHRGHDDRWFYRKLFRNKSSLKEAIDTKYLGNELSPLECVDVFKSASVALTMRFHSLVFAIGAGIPAVTIDYTLGKGKVKSLAENYEVPHMSMDEITRDFIFSSLSDFLSPNSDTANFSHPSKKLYFTDALRSCILSLNKTQ